MCGFAGLLQTGSASGAALHPGALARLAQSMAATLVHRGPDDDAVWADEDGGIGFGFRRLSILDLSLEGRQPMHSHCGRYVLVYNGEIYNHAELRAALGPQAWRGHSDTEVLLAVVAHHGVEATLQQLNGMFAIALWDRQRSELWLARDRFGEKPLYVGRAGGDWVFASELRALRRHPRFDAELDPAALSLFLRYGYVPGPLSVYRGVHKLAPGHYVRLDRCTTAITPTAFWDPFERARACASQPFAGGAGEAADALAELVDDATRRRAIADVPLGAFLSGGIDSSTVVAAMACAGSEVRTFSIGFEDPRYDESRQAEAVAAHLGTRHTTLMVSAGQCLDVVPRLCEVYDEPFADASQIPTVALCELTRAHVTVSLSGDGGDELFGGYPRYRDTPARWARIAAAPRWRRAAARGLLARWPVGRMRVARKLRRALAELTVADREQLFRMRVSQWLPGEALIPVAGQDRSCLGSGHSDSIPGDALAFMVFDAATYLPDDLQVKMDRASMSASLEVRAPLLDHRVAEFAWRLPADLSVTGPGKRVLREVLYRRVPRTLLDRPKRGFEPPIGEWLRGPLRERAAHHFSASALSRHGLMHPAQVARRWTEHLAGRNRAHSLWTVFMLGDWLERHA